MYSQYALGVGFQYAIAIMQMDRRRTKEPRDLPVISQIRFYNVIPHETFSHSAIGP